GRTDGFRSASGAAARRSPSASPARRQGRSPRGGRAGRRSRSRSASRGSEATGAGGSSTSGDPPCPGRAGGGRGSGLREESAPSVGLQRRAQARGQQDR